MKIRKNKGQITFPEGFEASGVSCGIKKSGKKDMGLLAACKGSHAAAVFTKNTLPAAPLRLNREHLKKTKSFRAVIVTSGSANCGTGKKGLQDSIEEAKAIASDLSCRKEEVLVLATGKIGTFLPMDKIRKGIKKGLKNLRSNGGSDFSNAILTTDTFEKTVSYTVGTKEKKYRIAGTAKGAGMIQPDMATMLAFITTDVPIKSSLLKKALKDSVDVSFNRISVDGCMSTNDTVFLVSSGKASYPRIEKKEKYYALFVQALQRVCSELARMIIKDGEGLSKVIDIEVKGALTDREAKKAAESVANSNLFKTAVYGESANWGRIYSSIGASGAKIKEKRLTIRMCGVTMMRNGEIVSYSLKTIKEKMKKKEISVLVDLGIGRGRALVSTVDLTPDYIRINKG